MGSYTRCQCKGLSSGDPTADILDSAATMELIIWLEEIYSISVPDDDLVIENFGTINLIIEYLQKHS